MPKAKKRSSKHRRHQPKTTIAIAWLLAILLLLPLLSFVICPATAADAQAGEWLSLSVTPYIGGMETEDLSATAYNASFYGTIAVATDENGAYTIDKENSIYGVRVRAKCLPATPQGCQLQVRIVQDSADIAKMKDVSAQTFISQSSNVSYDFRVPTAENSDAIAQRLKDARATTYYIYAVLVDSKEAVLDYTMLSVSVSYTVAAANGATYTMAGLQVREVETAGDRVPLGQYDYTAQTYPASGGLLPNTTGVYQEEDSLGTYQGLDGKTWSNAYFDVLLDTNPSAGGITNLEAVTNAAKAALNTTGAGSGQDIILSGPAYLTASADGQAEQTFNMAYYNPSTDTDLAPILNYGQWDTATQYGEFVRYRLQSLILPALTTGQVTVRCWNVEDVSGPIYTYTVDAGTLAASSDIAAQRNLFVSSTKQYLNLANSADPLAKYAALSTRQFFPEVSLTEDGLREAMALDVSLLSDAATQWEQGVIYGENALPRYVLKERVGSETYDCVLTMAKTRNAAVSSLKGDSTLAGSALFPAVTPPELDDYVYDFGMGYDALSAQCGGAALLVGTSPTAELVVTSDHPTAAVNLYYRPDTITSYTVAVRKDGVVIDEYTSTYSVNTGTIVEREALDTSFLPSTWSIQAVTGVPLVCQKDSGANIIYIDCVDKPTYTVQVEVNGTLAPELTTTHISEPGANVTRDSLDLSFLPSDWLILEVEGVPLTVGEDSSRNIITVSCTDGTTASFATVAYLYYVDGALKNTVTQTVPLGTTITAAPSRHYSGYKYSHTDGTPIVVPGAGATIRVYYVKDAGAPSARATAKLYSDQGYKVEIVKSKSGYGVYGLLTVDVSSINNAKQTVRWSERNGCAWNPTNKSGSFAKYKVTDVTATATYTEGLPISNKDGKKTTVRMVKDNARSNESTWVFRFPVNTGNKTGLAKAYIPINWKDGQNWTISFTANITYNQYDYTTPERSFDCGLHGHAYTYYPLVGPTTAQKTTTAKASASIRVNGNMYEDDATGGRK